jgi:hypothetical protein
MQGEHGVGNAMAGPIRVLHFLNQLVMTALKALQTEVAEPTLFDPADSPVQEGMAVR